MEKGPAFIEAQRKGRRPTQRFLQSTCHAYYAAYPSHVPEGVEPTAADLLKPDSVGEARFARRKEVNVILIASQYVPLTYASCAP